MGSNIVYIKRISIRSYLAQRGINPTTEKPGYGMYLSPLWEDTHANFKVDYNRNLWNDFGTGEGGSIIDLVARMENCSIAEAIRKLAYESGNTETILPNEQKPTAPKISRIEILSVGELEHLALVEYLRDRQIDLHRPAQFRNRPKTKRSQHSVH